MPRNAKFSLVFIAVLVIAVAGVLVYASRSGPAPVQADPGSPWLRPESHRLSSAQDGKVTVVEFLDFECEGCRAAYPAVEDLRTEYDGRVSFVIRYFPLPSHRNAELAARAVESAARQGQLVGMYHLMYETQAEWGERRDSQRETFVGFARDLGLDVGRFERDLDDPAVAQRVIDDRDDGLALGVTGTPTFFVNGDPLTPGSGYDELKAMIDRELAG